MACRRWLRGFRVRFRDAGRESFPAGIWRHGGDGGVLGEGEAGPGGRGRGPAGRGGGGGARRPGGAVRRGGRPGRRRGPGPGSRGAGGGDRPGGGGGFGQAQEVIAARTGVTVGRAQLAGLAEDLAAWTGDFYEERSRDAEEEEQPDSDVIMMQGDGKGIAMRPEHRRNAGREDGTRPGIKNMAEIVAVAALTPPVRAPEDIAAPPARRRAPPGPEARAQRGSASVTASLEDTITT